MSLRFAIFRACFLAALALLMVAGSLASQAVAQSRGTHVYMLTGLLGVTSGLDGLAAKIKQRGLPSTMSGPGAWSGFAQSATEDYKAGRLRSIVIVGYSTGGRSALEMADQLNAAKVPVQLVVLIDSMSGPEVTPNVKRLVNFYVPGGYGNAVARPKNFSGNLQNIPAKDQSVGHFTIIGAYENQLLNMVLSARSGPAVTSQQ